MFLRFSPFKPRTDWTRSVAERDEALPYYKWLVRDYRANRKVQKMSWQAKGLYRELLDEFWIDGPLPSDLNALAEICGCTRKEFDRYWPQICQNFMQDDAGRWVNAKMNSQRTDKDMQRVVRQAAGRLGGLAKIKNAVDTPEDLARVEESVANAKQTLALAKEQKEVASKCHIAEQSRAEQRREEQEQRAREDITPDMVAQAVLHECGLSGPNIRLALEAVVRSLASKPKYSADAARSQLIEAWQDYESNWAKLKYTWKAETFFGNGHWRTRDGWPWKEASDGKRSTRLGEGDAEAVIELFGRSEADKARPGRGEAVRQHPPGL